MTNSWGKVEKMAKSGESWGKWLIVLKIGIKCGKVAKSS